jgi:hypothetical protein
MAKGRRNADGGEDDKVPQQQQPPKKISKNINGRIKKYNFLKTVKSLEELDNFRLKV